MLEIGASLAKAIWYLQDRDIVHSNIRCRNVFVAKYDQSITVKLSDTGVPDYTRPDDLFYLAPELLEHRDYKQCTIAGTLPRPFNKSAFGKFPISALNLGDIWAYGTTMWQVFHFGQKVPTCLDEENLLAFYKKGHRLEISGTFST